MKSTNQYIQFEVETRMASMGMFGGGAVSEETQGDRGNGEYEEVTEDDVNALARILGGG